MSERSRPVVDLAASCACGAVTVTVRGTIYSMFMCSCLDCQKASGTGHSTVAIADPASVTITGETRSFTRPSDSGATFTRIFCPVCGTPLGGRSSRAERSVMLPVGLFGNDSAWFAPTQLIFSRTHRDWDSIAADLPRHATYRERKDT
jgi:hypothetical protein